MAIITICPYCREGKVRAPINAIGLSATCPRCYSCFTIVKSDEPDPGPVRTKETSSSPLAPTAPALRSVREDNPHRPAPPPLQSTPTKPASAVRRKPVKEEEPAPAPPPPVFGEEVSRPLTLVARGLALVAIILGGVGLVLSQLPFGHYTTLALAGLGLLLALLGWLAAGRRWPLPMSASVFNVAILLLLFVFPDWLGLASWWPANAGDDPKAMKAVNFEGIGTPSAEEWIDVSKGSWQRGDVRVSVRFATIGPVELKGPNNQTKKTDKKYLQVWMRLANEGLARSVEFRGWSSLPATGSNPVRITGPNGTALALKTFTDPGWQPDGRTAKAMLFPGKSAVDLLIFEAPAKNVGPYRLELPSAAFGEGDPVRLLIPSSSIEEL